MQLQQIEEIVLRPAVAEDAEAGVPLIYSSGPDAFDYIFHHPKKGSAQDFLKFAFRKGGGEFGFDNHLAVELDERVVAIGAGWPGSKSLKFMIRASLKILQFYGLFAGIGVMLRGLRFENLVRPPLGKQFAVAHLGVSPNMRGRGVGKQLIEALIQKCDNHLPILDVSDINPRAKDLYERLGFKVTKHVGSKIKRNIKGYKLVTVPGHSRMAWRGALTR